MVEWNILSTFARMKVVHAILSKRLVLALLVVLGLYFPVLAHSVDSLYFKFQNCEGKDKIELANTIFNELAKVQFLDTVYHYNTNARLAAVEQNVHYWLAEYYYNKGQYSQSLEAISNADELSNQLKDVSRSRDVLTVLYKAHYQLGNYDKALCYLQASHKIYVELKDNGRISDDLNALAIIYLTVNQPQPGIKYIERAINLERKLKREDYLAKRLSVACELYLMNHEPEKAMAAIEEAYQIDNKAGRVENTAIRSVQKSAVLEELSKYDEALSLLGKALPVLQKAENIYYLAACYNQLASVNEKLGHHDEAADYYNKALVQSIKCGSAQAERIAERGLWQTMRDEKPSVALIHLERYAALTDSLQAKLTSLADVRDLTALSFLYEQESAKQRKLSSILRWGSALVVLMLLLMLAGMTFAWRKSRSVMAMQRKTQELKSHFFTNITNELQTPLTVIMSAGRQLMENGKTSADDGKRMGEMIVSHGNNMLSLVNQLLEIENVKSAIEPPDIKHGDIVMFVRMLVDNFNDEAHRKSVLLNFSSSLSTLEVEFAPEYIRNILRVLITLGIKFTPSNGSVTVGLGTPETDRLCLTVSDTGMGIPEGEVDRMFEPLSQGGNFNDDAAGVSAGLTLVKQIVDAMGGSISVDSKVGEGTAFAIHFPARFIKDNDETAVSMSQFAERRIRQGNKQMPLVFVVENNEDVAYFIANRLGDRYNLRFARDGREALQNAQDLVPDLIITNMTMPVMDGWELIRRLRSTPTLKHIPIIAMTSKTSDQERMACFEVGADNVLVKPFNSSELRVIAEHLVNQRSVLRDRLVQNDNDSTENDQPASMSTEDREFISKLIDVILAQMAKGDIDVEHIAAALSLSAKQLRTRLMSVTGLTPVAFVLRVRLNHARRMMTDKDTSLTVIAQKCGFQHLSYFSKAFKQQFGVSPQQYRKNHDDITDAKTWPEHKSI